LDLDAIPIFSMHVMVKSMRARHRTILGIASRPLYDLRAGFVVALTRFLYQRDGLVPAARPVSIWRTEFAAASPRLAIEYCLKASAVSS
jgi:hypothetical protein